MKLTIKQFLISYLVVQYYLFSSGRIAEQRLQNYNTSFVKLS